MKCALELVYIDIYSDTFSIEATQSIDTSQHPRRHTYDKGIDHRNRHGRGSSAVETLSPHQFMNRSSGNAEILVQQAPGLGSLPSMRWG